MSLSQLLAYIPEDHRPDIERWFASFTASHDGDALDRFANALHERGLLTAAELHEYLTFRALTVDARQDGAGEGWSLMAVLGRGGMGEVCLGTEPALHRPVAVKRLNPEHAQNPVSLARFVTEAQITAQLDHPAIIPIYGLRRDDDGNPSYAMKFVRGATLTDVVAEARRQIEAGGRADATHSMKARVETFVPVLNALAYAHRRGVIHRDLKLDNVMVGAFGEVLVMDWGIARLVDVPTSAEGGAGLAAASLASAPPGATLAPGLTTDGSIVGTPDFMSPEQARGEPLGPASDQYALGLILQELVTLQPAVSGRTAKVLIDRAAQADRDPVTSKYERVPRELVAIIAKATAPRPADRYASVERMADDVRRFLRDESVEAEPDSGLQRVQRWIGNHRTAALGLGVALTFLVFAVAAFVLWRGQVALEAERQAAEARERAVMAVGARVAARAKAMTEELHGYELLLARLAATAEVFLAEPAPPSDLVAYTYARGRREPDQALPDLIASKVYGRPTTLRHPDLAMAFGADRQALRPTIDRLARLEPVLRDTLLASAGPSALALPIARAERLALQEGVPLVWAYVAVESGLLIGLPAAWGYDDSPGGAGYDPRREGWYREAADRPGPSWHSGVDEAGLGLLLSCIQAVRDRDGVLLGVAAIDLSMSRFIATTLEEPVLVKAGAEAMLVDRAGRVLVRSSQKDVAATVRDYTPVAFEVPSVVAAIATSELGHLALPDGRLASWSSLGDVGITYLVIGPEERLLATAAPPVAPEPR